MFIGILVVIIIIMKKCMMMQELPSILHVTVRPKMRYRLLWRYTQAWQAHWTAKAKVIIPVTWFPGAPRVNPSLTAEWHIN